MRIEDETRRARVEQLLSDSDDLVSRMRLLAAQLKAFGDDHRSGGEPDAADALDAG